MTNLVFLEIQLKDDHGFYTGQLSQFSIVQDEEPHKLVYLISPEYKAYWSDEYAPIIGEGVLLDLSEAVSVHVIQTPEMTEVSGEIA